MKYVNTQSMSEENTDSMVNQVTALDFDTKHPQCDQVKLREGKVNEFVEWESLKVFRLDPDWGQARLSGRWDIDERASGLEARCAVLGYK